MRWSWREGKRGFVFDDQPRIVWGEGTTMRDLRTINFERDCWLLDHYRAWAADHPGLVAQELWWVPEGWRERIKRLYFPW